MALKARQVRINAKVALKARQVRKQCQGGAQSQTGENQRQHNAESGVSLVNYHIDCQLYFASLFNLKVIVNKAYIILTAYNRWLQNDRKAIL